MTHPRRNPRIDDMDTNAFSKLVPGFDFLQGLMQSAGQAAPAMGQWIAPTLNPEELEKRIGELKTVQFWLEQNARMISMTIQALEVQRMTLSTLQTMNLPMAELRNALTLPAVAPQPKHPSAPAIASAPEPAGGADDTAASPAKPGVVDPMQWWGALTQQFTELAAKAVQDSSALATRNLAGAQATAHAAPKNKPAPAAKPAATKTARKRS
jgi:hypothetical protein